MQWPLSYARHMPVFQKLKKNLQNPAYLVSLVGEVIIIFIIIIILKCYLSFKLFQFLPNRLACPIITFVSHADGPTHPMWGKLGRPNESSIEPWRWATVSIFAVRSAASRLLLGRRWLWLCLLTPQVATRVQSGPHREVWFGDFVVQWSCEFLHPLWRSGPFWYCVTAEWTLHPLRYTTGSTLNAGV